MRYHYLFLSLSLALFTACTSKEKNTIIPENTPTTAEAAKLIVQQGKNFSKYFVEGDFDAMLAIYTDDAKIFPAGQRILSGQHLRDYWLPKPDATSKVIHHQVHADELQILGKEAYEYGYYEGTSKLEDGSESSWGGKYLIVWKEVEPGTWKMYLDIWNQN